MRLSVCMMVKNETKYLAECLEALQPIRDAVSTEIVIVDTGSEDDTVEIARKYTDKVYFYPWNNNFAEMRNITIGYAQGEWVFILDADEIMQNTKDIIDFLNSGKRKNYAAASITFKNLTSKENKNDYSLVKIPRLFKRAGFYYTGAIHEQFVIQGPIIELKADLAHYGYMSSDAELMEGKFKRSKEILQAELEKDPENVYYLYQLSSAYGMYKDFDEALKYALKAYEAMLKNESLINKSAYIYANLMFYYQRNGNYAKVEEIGKEALKVYKQEYIDVYCFLGESQIKQNKWEEAIVYYEKYLELINNYNAYEKQKDYEITDYTLGQSDIVYMNLFICCSRVRQQEKAYIYGSKVKDKFYITDLLPKWIPLALELSRYEDLKQYYKERILGEGDNLQDLKDLFRSELEKARVGLEESESLKIAECFAEDVKDTAATADGKDEEDYYGLYNRLILEEHGGEFTEKTLEVLKQIDFSQLPVYCSGIFYYLIKRKYALTDIVRSFNESWLEYAFAYLAKQYGDFAARIVEYLEEQKDRRPPEKINSYKIDKLLFRYALQGEQLSDDQYRAVFEGYVQAGVSYLEYVYRPEILRQEWIYDLKNNERIFFLYMYKARVSLETDQAEYLRYLSKALKVLPEVKRGVEILLRQFEESRLTDTERELRGYQRQVKAKIEELIEVKDFVQASYLINEYEKIFANDPDIHTLKAIMDSREHRWGDAAGLLM